MNTKYYNIYCDESDTNGQNIFWLGAILCTPERARILDDRIERVRYKYNYYSEFKWTKLKKHNYKVYKDLVDIFFEDKVVQFRLMKCKKNYCWNTWETNFNKRMAKTYYCFIGKITFHDHKYCVYADQLFNDYGKSTSTIRFSLNNKRKKEWNLKYSNIQVMKEVNSSKQNLIQLTDVLMGAYKAENCTNKEKMKMFEYVKEKMSEVKEIKAKRFEIYGWNFR